MKKKRQPKIKLIVAAIAICTVGIPHFSVKANRCLDLRIVFARGSGEEYNTNESFNAFKNALAEKLPATGLEYEFIDLDYPAIGIDNLTVALGAYFGAGNSFRFGESVDSGVQNLVSLINNDGCPKTKYVIGGYSQGALVVTEALSKLNADKITYVATFGDPKLFLPEGAGLMPSACRGMNLSNYRIYVPDCRAFIGLLGASIPYEPEAYAGKIGTWCNKNDIFCSSGVSINDHTSYVSGKIYDDASKYIFNSIIQDFNLDLNVISLHDTAFLIDTSGSMAGLIEQYKSQAIRLAENTLASGGRIALFDYRDLADPYFPTEYCNFENCTIEKFKEALDNIRVDGGGDLPESLLSASFNVLRQLNWKFGSTKSLVVFTDSDFLSPDRDGVSMNDVVRLSKLIDPVNFYIVSPDTFSLNESLAELTGGRTAHNGEELDGTISQIIERFDALPRVEESEEEEAEPELKVLNVEDNGNETVKFFLENSGDRAIVLINDVLAGFTDDTVIEVSGLNRSVKNSVSFVAVKNDRRGRGCEIIIEPKVSDDTLDDSASHTEADEEKEVFIPKAPNTGRA
ncbi:MAG: cutinase family protein [Candidatus Saccharibacteria bacterium]|nr:cutinase family protein [Candidatus Saccharibacteria bacterium]